MPAFDEKATAIAAAEAAAAAASRGENSLSCETYSCCSIYHELSSSTHTLLADAAAVAEATGGRGSFG